MTTPTDRAHLSHPSSAALDAPSRPVIALDSRLDASHTFQLARGALVELSGGTESAAAKALARLAAQLCLPSTAIGSFFLACLAARDTDDPTRELVGRVIVAASPDSHITKQHVARLDDSEPTHRLMGTSQAAPLDGTTRLSFRGELDMATRPAFETAIIERSASAKTRLLLDLRDLTFCDISGIRALATVHDHVTAGGGSLQVRPPSALSSRRMLHLAVAKGWLPNEFAHSDTG